jgi:hypothetical protein
MKSGSYTPSERESYKEIVFSYTIQLMAVILDAMQMMQIPLGSAQLEPLAKLICSLPP